MLKEGTLWVELLSLRTFIYVIFQRQKYRKVYYIHVGIFVAKILPVLNVLTFKTKFISLEGIVFSEIKIDNIPLYQHVQSEIIKVIKRLPEHFRKILKPKKKSNKLNRNFVRFLQDNSIWFFENPIELFSLSQALNKKGMNFFIFKSTPYSSLLVNFYPNEKVKIIPSLFFNLFGGRSRRNYYLDTYTTKSLFLKKTKFFLNILFAFIGEFFLTKNNSLPYQTKNISINDVSLGVEINQDIYAPKNNNDFIFLEYLNFNRKNIKSFIFSWFIDDESVNRIQDKGIAVYADPSYCIRKLKSFFTQSSKVKVISFGKRNYPKILFLGFLAIFRSNNIKSWIQFNQLQFNFYSKFWKNAYKTLNVKILWTMVDEDPIRSAKIEALESVDSIYAGSHWSIYPFLEHAVKKNCHLCFIWGDYFRDFIHSDYNAKIKIVGYLPDCLFKEQLHSTDQNKYTITYYDNISANDLHSSNMDNLVILRLLVNLIEDHETLSLNIKLKRDYKSEYVNFILKESEKSPDRIKIFSEDAVGRIPPYRIAQTTDLAIGINFSTASFEAYSAGAESLYVNLSGIKNPFLQKNEGKVVFTSLVELERAIIKRIKNRKLSHKHTLKIYDSMDPYQDGRAAERVAKHLSKALKLFSEGYNSKKVLEKI